MAGTKEPGMEPSVITTFLFTDIEGSSRLWEQEPVRMPSALAQHDALARGAVERHRGTVVKMIGDGMHAAFADPVGGEFAV
jgi:class 3 adenylate cyclase